MPLYLLDILILILLAFFAWRGARKGLILSLCGLAGLVVAFLGARLISSAFYIPASNLLEPGIYQMVMGAQPEGEQADPAPSGQEEGVAQPQPSYSLEQLLDSIREAGVFAGLSDFLEQAAADGEIQPDQAQTPAQALAGYIARLLARAGLFVLSFLLILLIWFLVSRMLDLAFHLPILSALNWTGGLVLGLLKAAVVVVVLVWLGQLAGWVPAQPDSPVTSLFTLRGLGRLLNGLLL